MPIQTSVTPMMPATGIRLRADLHHGLDNHVFVPYPSGDRFVAVFPKNSTSYAESYHRRCMEINSEVSVEFLYARFAYSIIHILRTTAMIEPMAQIAVRPSIHQFAHHRSMSGRAREMPPVCQGSSETSIQEFNEDTSMYSISL